jgi:cellobiose phosphorylase
VLGTKDQLESGGALFTNQNAFAVIAGLADEDRKDKIFASFQKYLDTEWGSHCFYPPFPEPERRAGIISRFAPGTKENGSLQGHNSRWRIWAEFEAGRGDQGYELIRRMLPPVRHEADPELYRIEPYVACQFIYAPQSDRPGEGSHAWATGTAAWTLLNVWEHMLGVRPTVDGLRIDPCLPSDWTEASMTRNFRGATYEISINKPKGICRGQVAIELNGEALEGNLIAPAGDGKTHKVTVTVS